MDERISTCEDKLREIEERITSGIISDFEEVDASLDSICSRLTELKEEKGLSFSDWEEIIRCRRMVHFLKKKLKKKYFSERIRELQYLLKKEISSDGWKIYLEIEELERERRSMTCRKGFY